LSTERGDCVSERKLRSEKKRGKCRSGEWRVISVNDNNNNNYYYYY